ncbi:NERD domain-containing protein [Candidatus Uhrbacteria bacterium]|nr:NERD domain-containing protein [Candidatus Uhrbacteria bacterium]
MLFPIKLWLEELLNRIDGLKGEYKVSTALSQMWQDGVRHVDDLMLDAKKRGNIDHIAITKNGVWVIETKYQNGEITMENGTLLRDGKPFFHNKDYIFQIKKQVSSVEYLLRSKKYKDVQVRSVIVFAGPYSKLWFGVRPQKNVYIVGSQGLRKLLIETKHDGYVSSQEIDSLKTLFEKYQA